MTRAKFLPKESIIIDGKRLVFEYRAKDGKTLVFTDPDTGLPVKKLEDKVVSKLIRESATTHRVEMIDDDTPVAVNDYSREIIALKPGKIPATAAVWQTYVARWRASGIEAKTGPKLQPIIDEVAAELPHAKKPSIKTMEFWIRRAHPNGIYDPSQLYPRNDLRGRTSKLDHRVRRLLEYETYRLKEGKRPINTAAIVRIVNRLIAINFPELKEVGKSTFYRYVKTLNKYKLMMSQRGRIEARKLMPYGAAPMARRILEVVQIDHTPLNLWIKSPCRRFILGRPIITTLMDEYSGMILGYFVGFKEPSAYTVNLAILHAIRDKSYLRELYPDLVQIWPTLGLFLKLRCDNGAEFHGTALLNSAAKVGFVVEWCPKSEPWYKGAVENHFNTLDLEIQHVSGSFESKNGKRPRNGTYNPKKEASFTLEDLNKYLTTFFVDKLHVMPYTDEGDSRLDLWNKSVIAGNDPELPRDMKVLEALFARPAQVTLTKDGIEVMGLRYSGPNEEFNELYAAGWEGKELTIQIDDGDISYIWVPHPTRRYIKVYCTTPKKVLGHSYDTWDIVREKVREKAMPFVKAKGKLVDQAQLELLNQIEAANEKQVMANRKARALKEVGQKQRADKDARTAEAEARKADAEARKAEAEARKAEAEVQKLLTPVVAAEAVAPTAPTVPALPVQQPAAAKPPKSANDAPQTVAAATTSEPSFEERMRQRRAERENQKKEVA